MKILGFGLMKTLVIATLSFITCSSNGLAADSTNMDFGKLKLIDKSIIAPLQFVSARDGAQLAYRNYGSSDETVLIFYHGSGTEGGYLDLLARRIAAAGSIRVIIPNARGHYRSGNRRGDIDYVGQLEDDLEDMIVQLKFDRSVVKLYLAGHSSGGGFATRYAGSKRGSGLSGLILMAPYLGYKAPSSRKSSGGWVNVDTPKIIQISYLNSTGDRSRNGETVLTFNMPKNVANEKQTLSYSYRMMTNFGSKIDFAEDISGISVPIFVLSGGDDRSMNSAAYFGIFRSKAAATVRVLEGVGHLDIVSDAKAIDLTLSWLANH